MRIALVASPFGSTGGPEVVTQNLAVALKKSGVDCTLFAPKDWPDLGVKHIPTLNQSLWAMDNFSSQGLWQRRNYIYGSQTVVLAHQQDFDLIHLHSMRSAYPVTLGSRIPVLTTLHSLITEDIFSPLKEAGTHTVALSRSQAGNYLVDAVIGNGIPTNSISPSYSPGKYLLAVGRLNEQKGIHQAIRVAKMTKRKLIIIGRVGVSPERQAYYKEQILPFIDGEMVQLIESVPHEKMYSFYQGAHCLLHTITSPETHSLAAIEALACGTPVIGTKVDPLPEILPDDSSFSFLSNNLEALAEAVESPDRFDRRACRQYAENNFDSLIMADHYISLYKKILQVS